MREKEKMLSGKLYFSMDRELVKERNNAKKLCLEFNRTAPLEQKKRKKILKKLLGESNNCYIEPPFYCDYGYNIKLGNNFYANHNCVILDVNTVRIGNDVLLGAGVHICTASHPIDPVERKKGLELGIPIEIGDNVWIGSGAIILGGLKIGDNSVIGAGSIVTKDIPPDVMAAGNPCSVIRELG